MKINTIINLIGLAVAIAVAWGVCNFLTTTVDDFRTDFRNVSTVTK